MEPSKQLDIERAARHLAEVTRIVEPGARFAPASVADLSRILAEFALSPDLLAWYQCAAPMSAIYVQQFGNDLRIAGIHELVQVQQGYRWVQCPITAPKRRAQDWPESWVVFADEGADPLIADTSSADTPILKDMHGMGQWDPWLLAPSLASYLEAQARWIQICLIDSGFLASWERELWDDEGNLAPDIERRLRASLATILPDDCIDHWLS